MFDRLKKNWKKFLSVPAGTRFRRRYEAHRHQQGGLLRKLVVIGVGSLVVLLGIIMMVLPGPGVLVALLGAALIAEESLFVARALDRIDLWARGPIRRWRRWRASRRRRNA